MVRSARVLYDLRAYDLSTRHLYTVDPPLCTTSSARYLPTAAASASSRWAAGSQWGPPLCSLVPASSSPPPLCSRNCAGSWSSSCERTSPRLTYAYTDGTSTHEHGMRIRVTSTRMSIRTQLYEAHGQLRLHAGGPRSRRSRRRARRADHSLACNERMGVIGSDLAAGGAVEELGVQIDVEQPRHLPQHRRAHT